MKKIGFIGAGVMGKSMMRQVLQMFEELAEQGMGDLGTQALIRHYE